MSTQLYDANFYQAQRDGSLESARRIVPLLRRLLSPRSVLDVGCGVGTWLSAFRESGVDDIQGVDGPWALDNTLEIDRSRFLPSDLSGPIDLGRRFDLAISLEVAEHLPATASGTVVDTLTRHADMVVFSAAIPHQGGDGHINEQWPEYWAAQFRARGFVCYDPLRELIWDEPQIEWWYSQNIFIAIRAGSEPAGWSVPQAPYLAPRVHPALFLYRAQRAAELESYLGLGANTPPPPIAYPLLLQTIAEMTGSGQHSCIVCGAGRIAPTLVAMLQQCKIEVMAIADQDRRRHGGSIHGVTITSLSDALGLRPAAALIASATFANEIREQILSECADAGMAPPHTCVMAQTGVPAC